MRKSYGLFFVALGAALAWSLSATAGVDFFGTAKIRPTFYSNFDFDDSAGDKATLNEGGWASGEHVRGELRLGWKASGEKWRVKMIAEADVIFDKDNGDRSFYASATAPFDNQPNAGGEFGIERAEMGYTFSPMLDLSAGWDIRYLDIKTGGLLYGDDHPFIGLKGKLGGGPGADFGYELLYLPIYNRDTIGKSDNWKTNDWRVYSLKLTGTFDTGLGQITVSPFAAFSDFEEPKAKPDANIYYYGAELYGRVGPIKPALEVVAATGDFDDSSKDISSYAAFAGVEVPLLKAFNPYAAVRYSRGDDDKNDTDVEGWVGITDISRFTPMLGMDGNILGEHLSSGASLYGAPLYGYSPENAVGGDVYGGIGAGGSGNNPGQRLLAVGATGDLGEFVPSLSYKAQAFFIWYDQTDNLEDASAGVTKVDRYAGTTLDLQVKYALSKNFAVDYIFSTFIPGQGIEDQGPVFGLETDDPAFVNVLTLAWKY
ncbi:MAG: hypothetical protein Kow0092_06810 [Deferrisomatales bacterium]